MENEKISKTKVGKNKKLLLLYLSILYLVSEQRLLVINYFYSAVEAFWVIFSDTTWNLILPCCLEEQD